ncbi:MAG: hypothetical protein PUA70_01580 [Oribacterium sp.]|nr:hypothetical protein [Oribacterium sp.]
MSADRLLLSEKYKAFLRCRASAEFLEGTTYAGKTTVGLFKFVLKCAESSKKLHILAAKDTGTAEKNIINKDLGILDDFGILTEYNGNGSKDDKIPHIVLHTSKGDKIIYVLGYGDKQKWQKALGGQYGCLYIDEINTADIDFVREAKNRGGMCQEIKILEAIRKGFIASPASGIMSGKFFMLNQRKLKALIKSVTQDMERAEIAILRKAIYNAQVYAFSGAGTYEQAVDMATKDMLPRGLNCIEYANGARHTLSDYADMTIRTASKRAYLQGEGEVRRKWGIHTVIVNKRSNPCPHCLPFVGKVFIDDVWSGGKASDGDYPLLSTANSSRPLPSKMQGQPYNVFLWYQYSAGCKVHTFGNPRDRG